MGLFDRKIDERITKRLLELGNGTIGSRTMDSRQQTIDDGDNMGIVEEVAADGITLKVRMKNNDLVTAFIGSRHATIGTAGVVSGRRFFV